MAEYIGREALEQFMASRKARGNCKFCRNYEICVTQGLNRSGSHLYCWQEVILPTADVAEVQHGEWKIVAETYRTLDDDIDEELFVECPFCQRRYPVPYVFDDEKIFEHAREEYPYCHCGAKMDGKECAENEID